MSDFYDNYNKYDFMGEFYQDDEDRDMFRDPGGRSALRAGEPKHPCPTCGRLNQLTDEDIWLGYQCDYCADALEGDYGGEY
jgi:hypothetical protein